MRRLPVLLLLAGAPFAAMAQTAGSVGFNNGKTINLAQCLGDDQDDEVGLNVDMGLKITWNTQPQKDTEFAAGGKYKVFVSAAESGAGNDSNAVVGCDQPKTSGGSVSPVQVGEPDGYDADTQLEGEQEISMMEIAGAAGYGACNVSQSIYICVQWYSDSEATQRAGFAKGTVNLNVSRPAGPPTITSVTGGDGKLKVSCDGANNTSKFRARARLHSDPTNSANQRFSSVSSTCSLTITGLTNRTEYDVVVFGLSAANNPSAPSAAVVGTPIPTHDYWDQCKIDGCPEQGGCATGGLAAGLLGALSTLVVLRRRKS